MWQRKQTLYLLIAVIVCTVCLCLPIGILEQEGMGLDTTLSNFCLTDGQGERSFAPLPLAVLLLLSLPVALVAIKSYKNRQLQAKLCLTGCAIMILWNCYHYAYLYLAGLEGDYHLGWPVALPLLAIVMFLLARRGVLADEALVRAADRIR